MKRFSLRSRSRLGSWGPVLLAIAVWGRALLRPDRAPIWGTASLQFIPWRAWAWQVWRDTHAWPWWNPQVGVGAPLIANLQMAWFYPPTWALWALAAGGGVSALAWGHGLLIVLHLLWAAAGMYRLSVALGLRAPGPAVAALAYGLSGYLATRAEVFLSMNAATAWLPWVLWLGFRLIQTPNRRQAAWLAWAVSLQILAGHAQTAWYTLLLLAGWLGFWTKQIGRTRPRGEWLRFARALLLAAGLTLLLTAPQVLPTAVYLRQSARATGVARDFALTYSLWPWRLLDWINPHFFGSPVTSDYWGYGAYYEDALYIGFLPWALALSTLVWVVGLRRGPNPRAVALSRWAWGVVVVAVLLALGRNTPVFPWLYEHLPTFAMFQAPTRWSLWAVFALALLAGMRAAAWPVPGSRARYWLNLGLAAAPATALLGSLALTLTQGRAHTLARGVAWTGLWATGALALARYRPRRARLGLWQTAVVLWVALDLAVSHRGWTPTVPAAWYAAPGAADMPAGRVYFPPEDEYAFKFTDFFRMHDLRPARPWRDLRTVGLPNVRLLDRAATWNNFDPLTPARYARLHADLEQMPPGARERILDRVGVVAEVIRVPTHPTGRRVLPRQPEPSVQWFPQARVVPDAAAAWQALWARSWAGGAAWEQVLVVEAVPLDAARHSPTDTARGPQRRSWRLTAPAAGWALLQVQAYPGWRATVDGQAVPLYIAEYTLLAVPVPAGRHTITLTYHPPGWPMVGWAAILGLLGLGWALFPAEYLSRRLSRR